MELNLNCPCPRKSCPRHGSCEECRANHSAANSLTSCEKKEKKEQRKEARKARHSR